MPNSSAGKGLTNKAQSPNHLHPGRAYKPYSERTNALIMAVTMPTEDEWQLYCPEKGDLMKAICLLEEFPDVWAEKRPSSLARNHVPIMVNLKLGFPCQTEAISNAMGSTPRNSEPLTLAEGCRDIDQMPIAMEHPTVTHQESRWRRLPTCPDPAGSQQCHYHTTVPNPCTLLSLLPPQGSWFTCLDLKDTFFCLCLAQVTQPLFAFEWEGPHTGRKIQMAWTSVPQEFKNSPTCLGETLAVDLSNFREENPSCNSLQYVDDLLLTSHNQEKCWEETKALLA
jgi:hypothetical protein